MASGAFDKQAPAPSRSVSSVGRALHQYRRGDGFNSDIFSSFQLIFSWVYTCMSFSRVHFQIRDNVRDNSKRSIIGPLQDPVTWYGINYAGAQTTQWEF